MNVVLWILQILLALAFAASGALKLTRPREQLAERMGWVDDFSAGTVRLIGALEVLAALGLILPRATGIAPVLTPLAALGLVALMIGAAVVHARRREYPMIAANAVLLVLAVIVAWGRFGPYGP